MKLHDLFENNLTSTDIRDIAQKNLVMISNIGRVYIISDVPAISKDQFNKLKDLSFKYRYEDARYAVHRLVDKDWNNKQWKMWEDTLRNSKIEELKWKDYVAKTKWTGRDADDDDFSE